jgi:hypothetical protein
MHSEVCLWGKRHLGGAQFELTVKLSQVAEDNLFEFDYRRDAPRFDVFLSRQAMSSAKQHYEDQQREAHYRLLHGFNWLSKRANYALQIMTVNDQARMEMAASIFRPDDPESGHR